MGILKNLNLKILLLFSIFIFASWLRIENLGYSNYQGDETRAFFNPIDDGEYLQFLLEQRKGPNQFIITGLLRDVTNNYENYFLTRLPFALAGILSVIVFFFVVKNYFNHNIAIFSLIFFTTNGFLIAFSRIVQYQSFVILFGLLGILLYQRYQHSKRYGFLYLSGVAFAISILFHYDGVFFTLPVLTTFMWSLFQDFRLKDTNSDKRKLKHHLLAFGLTSGILLSFYIPFILNISEETIKYWRGRITGEEYTKVSSSLYLFTVYQPILAIYIYVITTFMGFLAIIFNFITQKIKKENNEEGSFNSSLNLLAVLIWGSLPLLMLEIFVDIPGTHIYTYLIPGMIIMAFGANYFFEFIKKRTNKLVSIVFILTNVTLFLFLAVQSHFIFVDHRNGEYPWQTKRFLNFELKKPFSDVYHLSLFGFPYNRNWDDMSNFMRDKPGFYQTNERSVISNYYLKNNKRSKNLKFYVFIENPQSYINRIDNPKTKSYLNKITPIYTSTNITGSKSVIYYIPEYIEDNETAEKVNSDE